MQEATAELIIIDDAMADDRAQRAAIVQPIPTAEVTVVNEGDPITPTATMAERTEATAREGDQAATALAAPETAEPQAPAGPLVLTEVNILNLIEQRLARIGVDTSDVKEKLINKLTAKALADRSMVASVSDRLRDSSIFLDSVSQRIREFVIHGEGAPHLERAISDRVTEFNLEAQISNEVRNYVARGRDIHGVATNAAANAIAERIDTIRSEASELAEAPKVLADAIQPVIERHVEAAIAQRFPRLEGGLQAAIERLNRYKASIGLNGNKLTIKSTNCRHTNGNIRLYIETPKPPAGFWRQDRDVSRVINRLLGMCHSGDYIAYNGNEISPDDFAYLITINPRDDRISRSHYMPLSNNNDDNDRIALEIASETFEAFAYVPHGPWSERYVAHHIRQQTNLGLHFMAAGYRVYQSTNASVSSQILKVEGDNARHLTYSWDRLNFFGV